MLCCGVFITVKIPAGGTPIFLARAFTGQVYAWPCSSKYYQGPTSSEGPVSHSGAFSGRCFYAWLAVHRHHTVQDPTGEAQIIQGSARTGQCFIFGREDPNAVETWYSPTLPCKSLRWKAYLVLACT